MIFSSIENPKKELNNEHVLNGWSLEIFPPYFFRKMLILFKSTTTIEYGSPTFEGGIRLESVSNIVYLYKKGACTRT